MAIVFINFGLPTPVTYQSILISWLFDFVNVLLLGVLVFVFFIILGLFCSTYYFKIPGLVYKKIEMACIFFPTLILLLQLIFSLYVLYSSTSLDTSAALTIKVVGNQWYWSYEYSDMEGLDFTSYMKGLDDLVAGDSRLLSVDNRLVVPVNTNIRFCVTSMDVIHSWSLPSAGIKVDAVPGLLNTLVVSFPIVGVFYGQCSEICGANHSFMPICLEVTPWNSWFIWATLNGAIA